MVYKYLYICVTKGILANLAYACSFDFFSIYRFGVSPAIPMKKSGSQINLPSSIIYTIFLADLRYTLMSIHFKQYSNVYQI